MDKKTKSIFFQYYTQGEFIDKYKQSRKGAVDVIIPVIHTNELWQSNLFSF